MVKKKSKNKKVAKLQNKKAKKIAKPVQKKKSTTKKKPAKVLKAKAKPVKQKITKTKTKTVKEVLKKKPVIPVKVKVPEKPVTKVPVTPAKKNKLNQPVAPEVPSDAPVIEKVKIVIPTSRKPEPKGKYVLEYSVRSSVGILFEFISTPSGLSEWFADNVNIRSGGFFTFFWDGSQQEAKIIGYKDLESIRFQWLDKNDGSYFEFRIQIDELTDDVSLMITDFAANNDELQTNKLLWDNQVDELLHVIGSYT